MNSKAIRGAKIIINEWVSLNSSQRLLIVTDSSHIKEAELLQHIAKETHGYADIFVTKETGKLVGIYFDNNEDAFLDYDIIIAATSYSLVTTCAAKKAIKNGKKFLSLPLHTNDKRSMLEYDFFLMDCKTSKMWAEHLIDKLNKADTVRITTEIGSDLTFGKKNRKANFFNGNVDDCNGYSSASIEVFIPIEEDKTNGTLIVDGSFGYIGKNKKPVRIELKNGRIINIQNSSDGIVLSNFIKEYDDNNLYIASELGIGLNPLAKCVGNCYIEDESAFGTFHIGFGRNIALGGNLEANGHFDLTSFHPNIYADDIKIMEKGQIIF